MGRLPSSRRDSEQNVRAVDGEICWQLCFVFGDQEVRSCDEGPCNLVQISNLKVKNSLATSLIEFLDDARKTGRRLHKLSSKVGGAVDGYVALKIDFSMSLIITSIMAVNDYALQSINSAPSRGPSLLSEFGGLHRKVPTTLSKRHSKKRCTY